MNNASEFRFVRGTAENDMITVKLPAWLFDKISDHASRRERSLAAMIAMLLREAVQSMEAAE